MQSQEDISRRIAEKKPESAAFVKDLPILAWRIGGRPIEDLPGFIQEHLGDVDDTGYDPDYFEENRKSIIALQMTSDGPDFYVVGKSAFDESYVEVPLDHVAEKNGKLVERLGRIPDLQARFREQDPGLVGVVKTEPVPMIRMSEVGYALDEEITIAAPWGKQTKPAGRDAFLVHDESKGQYYMVNADHDGLPVNYVPAEDRQDYS